MKFIMTSIKKIFNRDHIIHAYLGWLALALFFLYQYMLRTFPGVMVDEIRAHFKITAEQFATLGSLNLVAYALLQIPFGILTDRIGVKKMCAISISICIIGTLLFVYAKTFWVAQLSRVITGVGSAAAFMCALKFIADHIPVGKRGFLMGATLAAGAFGALIIGNSEKLIGDVVGWLAILKYSIVAGVILLSFLLIAIKPAKKDSNIELNRKPLNKVIKDILNIFCSKSIIIYAVLAIGLFTPLTALSDLWGTAFIKQKFNLPKADSAQLVMVLYIGLTFGSLILPWLSEKYKILNQSIIFCSFVVLGLFCLIIYLPVQEGLNSLLVLLFSLGFFCGAEMMCFTGALIPSHKHDSGEIIGVVNTLNMLGGAISQQVIGWCLDYQWSGLIDASGLRQYTTEQFQVSLSILTILIFGCCIISLKLFNTKNVIKH